MSNSQSIDVLEEDVQRLDTSFVQTAAETSDEESMYDELQDISRSPSVEPGPSSTSRPGLNSLADVGNERPPYSNFTLIKCAILGSPAQRLTLTEIYTAIMDRFPWYKNAGNSWKNSVRHCLSLDTQFYKEQRDFGNGGYWRVSVDTPRGNKRKRKRNKKPSRRSLVEDFQCDSSQLPTSFPLTTPAFRGRASARTPRSRNARTPRAHDDDDDATVTSTALFRPQILSETGWTPYFPSKATNSFPTYVLAQHFSEVTYPEEAAPSVSSAPSASASSSSLSERVRRNEQ